MKNIIILLLMPLMISGQMYRQKICEDLKWDLHQSTKRGHNGVDLFFVDYCNWHPTVDNDIIFNKWCDELRLYVANDATVYFLICNTKEKYNMCVKNIRTHVFNFTDPWVIPEPYSRNPKRYTIMPTTIDSNEIYLMAYKRLY